MRVLFIVGSAEPGQDGVGDYTRRLATALASAGWKPQIVALYDPRAPCRTYELQCSVPVFRIPRQATTRDRWRLLQDIRDKAAPELCSLQFVPYGYHTRGLCGQLKNWLRPLCQLPWHIYFHETWIGSAIEHQRKDQWIGRIQRQTVKRLIDTLSPRHIQTHVQTYLESIRSLRTHAELSILPLFSNIPIQSDWDASTCLSSIGIKPEERQQHWLCLLFGTLYRPWHPEPMLRQLLRSAERVNKKLTFIQCGRGGADSPGWQYLQSHQTDQLITHSLGQVNEQTASFWMQESDFGIATTPWQLAAKSSVIATSIAHGLPMIVNRDDYHSRYSRASTNGIEGPLLLQWKEGLDDDALLQFLTQKRPAPQDTLPDIAQTFMNTVAFTQKVCAS